MKSNNRQVGGSHYRNKIQHWDWVFSNGLDYFQGQITKYIARWRHKNGIQDLEKALHFLEKYIELQKEEIDMADVTINVTGISANTSVQNSGQKRFQVRSIEGELASFDSEKEAMEYVKWARTRDPHIAFQVVDASESGEPTSAYVDQD